MTAPKAAAATIRALRTSRLFNVTLILGALISVVPTGVRAEAIVEGDVDAVRIKAREASVEEVLSALGKAFKLEYRTSLTLDRTIDGTYEGTLQRVIARVLENYNYVIKNSSENTEVVVLSVRKDAPVVTAGTPAATVIPFAAGSSQSAPAAEKSAKPAPSALPAQQTMSERNLSTMLGTMAWQQTQQQQAQAGAARSDSASVPNPTVASPSEIVALTKDAAAQVEIIRQALEKLPVGR